MLFIFAREAAGALDARHSLRPLVEGICKTRARPAPREYLCLLGCLKFKSALNDGFPRGGWPERSWSMIATVIPICIAVAKVELSKRSIGGIAGIRNTIFRSRSLI